MKKQLFGIAAGTLLTLGFAGCGKPSEVKVTWVETTGTITKSEQQGEAQYNWTFEFTADKPLTFPIPGPKPAVVGQKIKIKYNKADPQNYVMLEDIK